MTRKVSKTKATNSEVKLSEQWDGDKFKGYRRFLHGKMFTLGKDEEVARLKATALQAAAKVLKAQGRDWSDEVIQQAIDLAFGRYGAAGTSQPEKAASVQPSAAEPSGDSTVHVVIDQFIKSLDTNLDQKEFGHEQRLSLTTRLSSLKFSFADDEISKFFDRPESQQKLIEDKPMYLNRPPLKNIALKNVGEDHLIILKTFFVQRPKSRRTGQPLGVQTIRNNLQAAGRFFKWARKQKLWPGCEDYQDFFKFNRNQKRNMMTADEKTKKASPKDHMTLDDLKFYWGISMERTKLFQALAFWCAWTQKEIATFRKVEFWRDEQGEAYIDKSRSKTGEAGKWWIPEPIAQLAEKYMAVTSDDPIVNPDGLAFMTGNHMPLVHFGDGTKTRGDLIANYLWKPVQHYAQAYHKRSHSFKWFRKTMPDMIGQMTGNKFIAKVMLAQAVTDVADVHYINPLTEKAIAAAKNLWETTMKDIHVVNTKADEKQVEKAKQIINDWQKHKDRHRLAKVEIAAIDTVRS